MGQPRKKGPQYGGELLAIVKAVKTEEEMLAALTATVGFIKQRLTAAAIGGCHHCDEGDRGTPCWWCGLRNR